MGSNANKRFSDPDPAPARSAASKKLKRRHYEDEEDFSLPPPPASDEESVTEDESDNFDSDSDSDGSDDELETAAPAAAPSPSSAETRSSEDLLLGISAIQDEHRVALSVFRDECLEGMSTGQLSQSIEPTDAFLARAKDQEWASHDKDVDTMWDGFVSDIVKLGEGEIKREDLVKPSGPPRAVLTFFWHYPTWSTQKKAFGHVFDRTSPSLRFQHKKMGPNGWVRTHDRFPFRHPFVQGGVDWESEYPNWADIEARCHRFNKEMIKYSKIIFFIGHENHETWQRFITFAQGDRTHQVQLVSVGFNLPSSLYKAKPAFHTIRNLSGTVKQLIFSSYHSKYCIDGCESVRGTLMDLTWNAALKFAELDVSQYDTFTRGIRDNSQKRFL